MPKSFEEYLREPCDEEGCDSTATHNATSRSTGKRGQFCNSHMDWEQPAFARND